MSSTKRLSWVLAISLGLNLFLVGFGAMRFLGKDTPRATARERRNDGVEELVGPPTLEMKQQRLRIIENRERVRSQLSADPFNQDTAFLALSELRTSIMMAQELLHEQILHRFPKVPVEERRKFATAHFYRKGDKSLEEQLALDKVEAEKKKNALPTKYQPPPGEAIPDEALEAEQQE